MNPSFRESILLLGSLHGAEVETCCVVRAVKVSIPRLDIVEYVKAEIAEAPTHLVEGEYELRFEGRKMNVHKLAGVWRIMGLL